MDELLSNFPSSDFDFEVFWRQLTIMNPCFSFVSKRKDDELKSVEYRLKVIRFGALGISMQPALYRKHVILALQKQVFWVPEEIILSQRYFVAMYYSNFQIIP